MVIYVPEIRKKYQERVNFFTGHPVSLHSFVNKFKLIIKVNWLSRFNSVGALAVWPQWSLLMGTVPIWTIYQILVPI